MQASDSPQATISSSLLTTPYHPDIVLQSDKQLYGLNRAYMSLGLNDSPLRISVPQRS